MIKRALLSVSDKTGLLPFAQFLNAQGVELLSTGGTAKFLRDAGLAVVDVSAHTGFPEMMDGRVKTLHPKIHGGLLAVRDNKEHASAMKEHNIGAIDLLIINLYPFEETLARGAGFDECVENIDIGGPAMVRSASKNHAYVTVVTSPADYALVMEEMQANKNETTLATRKWLAAKAFSRTASYDAAISTWLNAQTGQMFPENIAIGGKLKQALHYGENPHQKAAYYATETTGTSLATAEQVQGAALSYNNLNDASAAFELVREFSEPAVVIVKHANPCGVAIGKTLADAFVRALACDPVSAYGGIIAVNRPLDAGFCEGLGKLFLEVMIAPEASAEAKEILSTRKKLKLLLTKEIPAPAPKMVVKTISGGFLYQEEDIHISPRPTTSSYPEFSLENSRGIQLYSKMDCPRIASKIDSGNDEKMGCVVTKTPITEPQMSDLQFAFTVAKHVKSNTIVLVKDAATIGIGAGQMSRIDSTRIACQKAASAGLSTQGCVLASDAFFPFSDNVELAAEAGVAAIIQPGGSIRDEEVIAMADKHHIGMVFTGIRHFRH